MKCYAYTDESGNSGLELFNTDQESFWTGTLISFSDVDTKYRTFHKELLDTVGKGELHGNGCGLSPLRKLRPALAGLFGKRKYSFPLVRCTSTFWR